MSSFMLLRHMFTLYSIIMLSMSVKFKHFTTVKCLNFTVYNN